MYDFQLVVENTWTYLKCYSKVDQNVIRQIETTMSYEVEGYSRYRRTTIGLDMTLFERDKLRYPTGLYSLLEKILTDCGYTFDVVDARSVPELSQPIQMHSKKLRDYQEKVVERAIDAQRGVIKIATGGGKTVVAAAIVARLNLRTLFIVYSIDLLEQTADEFEKMFQIKVGRIGGGYCNIEKINICTVQTLHSAFDLKYETDKECYVKEKISSNVKDNKSDIRDVVKGAEVVIVDECFYEETFVDISASRKMTIKDLCYSHEVTDVLSYNFEIEKFEKRKILRRVVTEMKEDWCVVYIERCKVLIKIICTDSHKIWVKDKGYVQAKDLVKDDIVKALNHEGRVLSLSLQKSKNEWKYNLEIEGNHNYFANSVLVSNCHKQTAPTYIQMSKLLEKSFYKFSLSATPYRDESIDKVLEAYSGKMICNINASYLIDRGFLVPPKIYMLDPNEHKEYKFVRQSYRTVYNKWIISNLSRNEMIVDSALRLKELGKSVLITVTNIVHGEILCDMLDKANVTSLAFIKGEVNGSTRKMLLDKVRNKELDVLVGSCVADEGVDLPSLGSAILAGGGKSLIKSLQRIGRTLRPYPSAENNEKKEAIIVDFYDRIRYLTGHSNKRMKIYMSEPRFQLLKKF